ncbi:MAG TPA: hypothetical protein VIJ79_13025 [Acidobacteriaceae bacterium]
MLKILLVFALALPYFPVQAHSQTKNAQQASKGDKPALPVTPVIPQNSPSPNVQNEHQEQVQADVRVVEAPDKDGYDKASVWINLALALIGVCGICAAFITLRKLERQTKATEDAANAAYGSVAFAEAQFELMKEKERARLEVTPGTITVTDMTTEMFEFFHLNATLRIRNIGATRAYITRGEMRFILVDRASELPDDLYSMTLPDQFFDPSIDRTDITAHFFPDDKVTMKMVADAIQGIQTAHLYGVIEYETLGGKWRREFSYRWDIFMSGLGLGYLGISSMPQTDADRIEGGYWTPTERDKSEYPISKEDSSESTAEVDTARPPS